MSKKKDSRALFELISKNREKRLAAKLGVPEWMGKGQAPALPGADEADREAPEPEIPPEQDPPHAPRPPAGRKPQRPAERVLVLENDRVKLSVSFLSAGVTGLGLLVLLLGAFWLGRYTAPAPADQPPEEPDRNAKKDGDAAKKPDPSGGRKPPGPGPVTAGLQTGKYYLVVETLVGSSPTDLDDARKIQEFCDRQGLPAKVMSYAPRAGGKARYMVWSLRPFDLAETTSDPGSQHAAQVEKLGQEYGRTHGKYFFKQGRDDRDRIEGWFLPYRQSRQP